MAEIKTKHDEGQKEAHGNNIEYLKETGMRVGTYVGAQISETGYMKASHNYSFYIPMWFRDSCFTSMALAEASDFYRNEAFQRKSALLLNFMWKSSENFLNNIKRGIEIPLEKPNFFDIINHFPARIGEDGWYRGRRGMESDNPFLTSMEHSNWLRQYDSVPLLIGATAEYIEKFGVKDIDASLSGIKDALPAMIDYMVKIYKTPCSNLWEMDTDKIHSYDVAAIYYGMNSAMRIVKYIKENLKNELVEDYEEIRKIKSKNYRNLKSEDRDKIKRFAGKDALCDDEAVNSIDLQGMGRKLEDIDKFLNDYFIRDGIMYKSKNVFKPDKSGFESEPIKDVDSGQTFIFTKFKPPCATQAVQENTMKKIEKDLFSGNELPIRFKDDSYFLGGRWPLLGLEAANWYLENGKKDMAEKIIDYITDKYLANSNAIPEQEIINPASSHDPADYLSKNNNGPISDLAWSESSYLCSVVKYAQSASEGVKKIKREAV
ncbi:hypothetical protein M1141_01050 [Candidatus Marsarchaeota archaeon]|nr:hypothetical protein [Candidatus Marsarchaeota archaeon]